MSGLRSSDRTAHIELRRTDFRQALKLEPANESVKVELKKVDDILQTQSKPKKVSFWTRR